MQEQRIRKEEYRLFDRWKAISPDPDKVVLDGIINVSQWLSTKKKVLFILRDKNGQVSEKYRNDEEYPNNFRKELFELGSGAKTWNNIARWGQALQDPELPYEVVKYFPSGSDRGKALGLVAAINLLKEYGSNRTDREYLDKLAERKRQCDLLREQIDLYQPELVVACGMGSNGHKSNMEILAEVYEVDPSAYRKLEINKRSYRYITFLLDGREVPILEFYHPQATTASAFGVVRGHLLWKKMFEDIQGLGGLLL